MNSGPVVKPVLLAIICGLLVSSLYFFLKKTVHKSRMDYETKQLNDLVGSDDIQTGESQQIFLEKTSETEDRYRISRNEKTFGHIYAIETKKGYNGRIAAWLAVDTGGRVLGVRIREHKETPGIGDKIDRGISDWIDSFRGQSLKSMPKQQDWNIRKDGGKFDQFTGATITPRAVIQMVHEKLVDLDTEEVKDRNR